MNNLEKIPCNTYNVSPSNKESGNELILENNTDHIDSKNEIVHELLELIGKIFSIKINRHVI